MRCKSSDEAIKAHEAGQCDPVCPLWNSCYWGRVPEGMARCGKCRTVEDAVGMAVVDGENVCNDCLAA